VLVDKQALLRSCRSAALALRSDGYFLFSQFLNSEAIEELKAELSRLSNGRLRDSFICRTPAGDVLAMTALETHSTFLFDFARRRDFREIAECLAGTTVVPLNIEFFSKPARWLTGSPPHQDEVYYRHLDGMSAFSFWVALDDVSQYSGAIEYAYPVPASLLPHKISQSPGFNFELTQPEQLQYKAIEVPCGGCLVHRSLTVHRSRPNYTDQSRNAIAFSFRPSRLAQQPSEADGACAN
jgi:hypothetical protein